MSAPAISAAPNNNPSWFGYMAAPIKPAQARTSFTSPMACPKKACTRECLALDGSRSFKSADVLDVLRDLFLIRGVPKHIRSDNGPEFIAKTVRKFLDDTGIDTLYIEPGLPWQNGYAESFNSCLRDELLDAEVFADLHEARVLTDRWKNDYNHRRPHSSLEYQTPAEFAARRIPLIPQPPTLVEAGT